MFWKIRCVNESTQQNSLTETLPNWYYNTCFQREIEKKWLFYIGKKEKKDLSRFMLYNNSPCCEKTWPAPARNYNSLACYIQSFNILASLCSWTEWFESYLAGHPEDRFSFYEAHICMADIHVLYRLVDLLIICYVWSQKILPRVHVVARSEVTAVDTIKCKLNGLLLPKNPTTYIMKSMTTIKNI